MAAYTIDQLCRDGPRYAMALLLRAIGSGEPFVTYGAIRSELEYQLKINRIFPTQIGYVAGTLMDEILNLDPKAPLINTIVTRANGIPGKGAGNYLAYRYDDKSLKDWDNVPTKKKFALIEAERKKIFGYKKWTAINQRLFGKKTIALKISKPVEHDFPERSGYGGPAESEQHKRLKDWVARNPKAIGATTRTPNIPECRSRQTLIIRKPAIFFGK